MAVRVAINGFGRIGRLAFRQMFGAEGYAGVQMNQELDAAEAQLAEEGRFAEDDEGMKLRHKAFQDRKRTRPRARPSTRSGGATSTLPPSSRPCATG